MRRGPDLGCLPYWQRTSGLLLSIAAPAAPPPMAPMTAPSGLESPGAMIEPRMPPATAPTIRPVEPSERRQ